MDHTRKVVIHNTQILTIDLRPSFKLRSRGCERMKFTLKSVPISAGQGLPYNSCIRDTLLQG